MSVSRTWRGFNVLVVCALPMLGGCDDAPKQPRVSSQVKPEGAAKDIKAKDAPPVKSDEVLEGEDDRRKAAPPDEPRKAKPPEFVPDPDRFVQTTLRPPLAPMLIPEFRQASEQEVAAMALGRIGHAAVPSLIQTLRHRDPQVRKQAALVLARIGPEAYDAVPELTDLLGDSDEDVRKAAARALGQIGPQAADAVPALMRQLVEPKPAAPRR